MVCLKAWSAARLHQAQVVALINVPLHPMQQLLAVSASLRITSYPCFTKRSKTTITRTVSTDQSLKIRTAVPVEKILRQQMLGRPKRIRTFLSPPWNRSKKYRKRKRARASSTGRLCSCEPFQYHSLWKIKKPAALSQFNRSSPRCLGRHVTAPWLSKRCK